MISNKFVYFPPGRKEYFFSLDLMEDSNSIYFFYTPFPLFTKIFWKLLLISGFFRLFFSCNEDSLPTQIKRIIKLLNSKDVKFQIKRGTEGPDKKVTLIRHCKQKTTFFKIGDTERGIELINSEYNILNELQGKFKAPRILNFYFKDGFQFMETDYISAPKLKSITMNEFIYNYILSIASYKFNSNDGLFKSFNHGDCCPWNFLQLDDCNAILIDWELAGEYVLGYDLFTFIFQAPYLLKPYESNQAILSDNMVWIQRFFAHFDVKNSKDYLNIFVNAKLEYEIKKGKDSQLIGQYFKLKNDLPNLQL